MSFARNYLLHGLCYPTAIVLHEETGWPISAIVVDVKDRKWLPHMVHAYLVTPDGEAFDASGFRPITSIDTFLDGSVRKFRNPRHVEFGDAASFRRSLRRNFMGAAEDEGHDYYDPSFDEEERISYDDDLDALIPLVRGSVHDLDILKVLAPLRMP